MIIDQQNFKAIVEIKNKTLVNWKIPWATIATQSPLDRNI